MLQLVTLGGMLLWQPNNGGVTMWRVFCTHPGCELRRRVESEGQARSGGLLHCQYSAHWGKLFYFAEDGSKVVQLRSWGSVTIPIRTETVRAIRVRY